MQSAGPRNGARSESVRRALTACDHGPRKVFAVSPARPGDAGNMQQDQKQRGVGGQFVDFLECLAAFFLTMLAMVAVRLLHRPTGQGVRGDDARCYAQGRLWAYSVEKLELDRMVSR